MKHRSLLLFLMLSNLASTAFSEDELSSRKSKLTPLNLLVVDKKTLSAQLRTLPEWGETQTVLSEFKIAIGKEIGDKQIEGDNKTPEGVYFTSNPIDVSTLPKKYGSQAIPIDFPNAIDRLQGKTGYGIWLHGVEKNSRVEEANVTEGCVAFFNEDIAALGDWLSPERAVVVIADDASAVNRDEDRQKVWESTSAWVTAWQNRDIEGYASFYHSEFSHRKGAKEQYVEYKSAVFRTYNKMSVDMRQLRVITHPKYAVSMMNQYFDGDGRYVSNGRKILYWQKDKNGQWRIIHEKFSGRLFAETPSTEADYSQLLSMRRSITSEKKQVN